MAPLWSLPAHALTAGYAAGAFTPTDALESVLERCDAVNPKINAVIARNDEAARQSARDSAQRWARGRPLSSIDGVPISVKDNLLATGFAATWGTPALRDHRPRADEAPVARLRDGGAVLFAKTNVPELTLQGYTDNALFGATGLPFAPDLTPGGSSGGAAAAVAAGIGPLALCTDGGGSIRRPAAHAGLFGFKPGAGVIPRGGGFPPFLGAFEVVGPMGRDAVDVANMTAWLSGQAHPTSGPPLRRMLYARHFGEAPVDAMILARCDAAADALRARGCEITVKDRFDAVTATDGIWPVISATGLAWLFRHRPDIAAQAGPALRDMAAAGASNSGPDYVGALVELERMRAGLASAMAGFDALLSPAIAAPSWPKATSHPETIDGVSVGPRGHAVFTAFANALGLPAMTLPLAPCEPGIACGLQVVGRPGSDSSLLSMAIAWMKTDPPSLPGMA